MERYIRCYKCGKMLFENSTIVKRTGLTGKYCSYECAAIDSGFFKNVKLTNELVQDDKICDGEDWLNGI